MFSKFINRTLGCHINEEEDYKSNIPVQVLVSTFSYLTSHQIAAARLVNRNFNKAGRKVLNRRFSFYCAFIPRALRNALRNHSVFPNESLKEGELHVLSAALLILRSIFGRYITTGRCCFYPGLILDHIESITLSATTKRSKWKLINILRLRGRHLYYRCVNKLFLLIEMAADHFERQIEPLLPPPRTFIGTKVLDLIASTSELQCEENIGVFYQKIVEGFPKCYPSNLNIHFWLTRLRSDIIHKNIQWIFKATSPSPGEITSSQMKLRWYSSQSDYYKSNVKMKNDAVQTMDEFHKFNKEICAEDEEEKEENYYEGEKYINITFPVTLETNRLINNFDYCNIGDYSNNSDTNILTNNTGVCTFQESQKINANAIKTRCMTEKIQDTKTYEDECQYLDGQNLMRSTSSDELLNYQANIKLIQSLINQNEFNTFHPHEENHKNETDNIFNNINNCNRESKTRKMLAKAETLLTKARELAKGSQNNIKISDCSIESNHNMKECINNKLKSIEDNLHDDNASIEKLECLMNDSKGNREQYSGLKQKKKNRKVEIGVKNSQSLNRKMISKHEDIS